MDMDTLKKSLDDMKGEILARMKAVEDTSEAKVNAMAVKLDASIALTLEQQKARNLNLPGLAEELKSGKKTFNFHKLVLAQVDREYDLKKEGAFEHEVLTEAAKLRSNNTGTGAAGGYMIPEEAKGDLIDLAMAATPIMEFGPTVFRGLRGELPIPKLTSRLSMTWVGEEEAAAESNVAFGEIMLRPKTASALTKVSRQLLYQSAGTVEAIVRQQLINAFQLGIEQAILFGTGSEKQPKGIVNFTNIATNPSGVVGNRFRMDDAAQMITAIDENNMLKSNGSYGFLMHPRVLSGMKRERVMQYSTQDDQAGMPVINPIVSNKVLEDLIGYKIRTTTLLAKGTAYGAVGANDTVVLFGDWKQLMLAFWEGFELRASDTAGNSSGSAFTQRQIWLTAFQSMDIGIKDETGFVKVTDASAVESDW